MTELLVVRGSRRTALTAVGVVTLLLCLAGLVPAGPASAAEGPLTTAFTRAAAAHGVPPRPARRARLRRDPPRRP
ncbi:hypothetical protein [Microbispora sp. GKU 823]|uniref:hypothetical protein n=1 Tax=Microbispora sp. GKU 823 TaxID=1652100 RepID=UPI002117A8C4|nr:hypothetical protein [Microbispora sp. GKU 823]